MKIIKYLKDNSNLSIRSLAKLIYKENPNDFRNAEQIRGRIRKVIKEQNLILLDENKEITDYSNKQAKKLQRAQDLKRIQNKVFRENVRKENASIEIGKELINSLKNVKIPEIKTHIDKNTEATAIVQLSDIHLNELIDLVINKYNFQEASRKLQFFAHKTKKQFRIDNIKNIVIAMTGDLMNSDRRLDEKLAMATNRANATILAVQLLTSFILDLNKEYNISILNVCGNESRLNEDMTHSDFLMSNNFDFIIFNMLKFLFTDIKTGKIKKGIEFLNTDAFEAIIEISGKNILFTHGDNLNHKNIEKEVINTMGMYSDQGIKIDFMIFGHQHSAMISSLYARSGSLCGSNAYSSRELKLISRCSQNIYVVFDNSAITSSVIDLQDIPEDFKGYEFNKELIAYNTKSAKKCNKKTIIHEIII